MAGLASDRRRLGSAALCRQVQWIDICLTLTSVRVPNGCLTLSGRTRRDGWIAPLDRSPVATQKEITMSHETDSACIEACNACAIACNQCAADCLSEDDVKMMARCIALDMDCAAICQLSAAATARGSEHAKEICRLCANICEACAQECEKHKAPHCQSCAKACRVCALACLEMTH